MRYRSANPMFKTHPARFYSRRLAGRSGSNKGCREVDRRCRQRPAYRTTVLDVLSDGLKIGILDPVDLGFDFEIDAIDLETRIILAQENLCLCTHRLGRLALFLQRRVQGHRVTTGERRSEKLLGV